MTKLLKPDFERAAVPQNGRAGNAVFHLLKSKPGSFRLDLLQAILSFPLSEREHFHPILQSVRHPGVTRCLRFIGRNPDLKLCDLTKISGLSRRGLHKAFDTHLGCAPGKVVTMVRLWNACDLLTNSRLPVAKIATCCGYGNVNSLYVAFERFLGTTPVRIRKESRSHGPMDAEENNLLQNTALSPVVADGADHFCLTERR